MNTDAKILNKIPANQIQEHIKKTVHHDHVSFHPRDARVIQHTYINKCKPLSKLKDRNHMIISLDAGKAFDKIQHPFIIKVMDNLCILGP